MNFDEDRKKYEVLSTLILHSDQIRWTRFNTLLIVDSILLVAWATIFASTPMFQFKAWLLTGICLPGIIFGYLWARLGARSSQYMDDFHNQAYALEKNIPDSDNQPYHLSEKLREKLRKSRVEKYTSSRTIVTWIPIVFSIIFIILVIASWFLNPNPVGTRSSINPEFLLADYYQKKPSAPLPNKALQLTCDRLRYFTYG